MASFPSADNTDYIQDLLKLCMNLSAYPEDFRKILWFSDPDECTEMFERTHRITPFNYSFNRRRTHLREHTTRIFDYIARPETEIGTALYWIAMTIYIIRANISGFNPVNLCIDEAFYKQIYMPLIHTLDTFNLRDHDHLKAVLLERIATLRPLVDELSQKHPFCDNFLRTVSCNAYNSPISWN